MGKLNINEDMFNDIMSSLIIENAFEDWAEYRKTVTEWIICKTEKGKNIAIWGAGRCNDIDLTRLSSHFSKIYLIDIDEEAMKEALVRYNQKENENIVIVVKDFLGITRKDYLDYMNIATKDLKKQGQFFSPFATAPKMVQELERMYLKARGHKIDAGEKVYDYSIALGVHSQLNVMPEHIWGKFLLASGKKDYSVTKTAHKENEYIVQKFNNAVFDATKESVFIGLEKTECGFTDSIQGVIQAKEDLIKRENMNEVILHIGKDTMWNFNSKISKAYIMELINVEILD